jgi:hypothetical protein
MSPRTRSTASLTSSSASDRSRSSVKSAMMLTWPSVMFVTRCCRPSSVAIEFSTLRATSVSSCAGAAPGKLNTTLTAGRSRSGKLWMLSE